MFSSCAGGGWLQQLGSGILRRLGAVWLDDDAFALHGRMQGRECCSLSSPTPCSAPASSPWTCAARTCCCCMFCIMRVLPPVRMRCLPFAAYTCAVGVEG